MNTQVGVWIDHRKAVSVVVTDTGEEIRLIISKTEKQLRRAGDSPLKGPYETQQVPADDSRERKLTGHLNIYYDAVIAGIREADHQTSWKSRNWKSVARKSSGCLCRAMADRATVSCDVKNIT
jgi:hypothetical protein